MPTKAIFLDRDDTLIHDPGYISHPDQVRLLEGVPDALNGFRKMGYKLVVVTNQSGIARGILTEDTLKIIHAKFKELLAEKNAYLDRIYYCPYHVDGVIEHYRKPSDMRKPNPGMLLKAAEDMDIELSESWCIGNSLSDVEAGQRAGCHTILINQMSPTGQVKPGQIRPNFIAVNLREALNIVKQFEANEKRPTQKPVPEVVAPEPQPEPEPEPEVALPIMPEPEPEPIESPFIMPATQDESDKEVALEAFLPEPEPEKEPPRIKKHKKYKVHPTPHQDQAASQPMTLTQQLLQGILDQLKNMQRDDMFDEFSLLRFVAGVAQIGVFVCLLTSVWFLLSPDRPYNPIFAALGFAVVLQTMCLTLTMQSRK